MQYIKLGDSTLLEFNPDNNTTSVYNIANLQAELSSLELSLATMPENPTDEQLLEWARANYPLHNPVYERESLQNQLAKVTFLLQKAEELE